MTYENCFIKTLSDLPFKLFSKMFEKQKRRIFFPSHTFLRHVVLFAKGNLFVTLYTEQFAFLVLNFCFIRLLYLYSETAVSLDVRQLL